jgi:hypothetical protein
MENKMSIYSSPYPFDGVEHCPTVVTAEKIVMTAVMIDGKQVLGNNFEEMIEWESGDGVTGIPQLKSRLGIGSVRKAVANLWRRMSTRAKANFFYFQYSSAVQYLDECMDNIRNEFGEVEAPSLLHLPSSSYILKRWL